MVKISVDLFYITFIEGTLMRNNSYKLNGIMNIIFKKRIIRRSYPNIRLHIN